VAVVITDERLGLDAAHVLHALLLRSRCTLHVLLKSAQELQKRSAQRALAHPHLRLPQNPITLDRLKNTLRILIRHQLVRFSLLQTPFRVDQNDMNSEVSWVEYEASEHHAVLQLRFPAVIPVVRERYGTLSALILQAIFALGTARIDGILSYILSHWNNSATHTQSKTSNTQVDQENLNGNGQEITEESVTSHLIADSNAQIPVPTLSVILKELQSVLLNHQLVRSLPAMEKSQSLRQNLDYTADEIPSKRRKMDDFGADALNSRVKSELMSAAHAVDENNSGALNGEDDDVSSALAFVWIADFEGMQKLMECELYERAARQRLGETHALVVRLLLRLSGWNRIELLDARSWCAPVQNDSDEERSTSPVLRKDIERAAFTGLGLDSLRLNSILETLADRDNGMLQILSDTVVLRTGAIMKHLRKSTLVIFLSQKFGTSARRLVNVMLSKTWVEQKQLSEMTMIPTKVTNELLYRMYTEGFVRMQEIPTTSDMKPSRSYFLWSMKLPECYRSVIELTLHSMLNLMMRLRSERNALKEVFNPQLSRLAGLQPSLNSAPEYGEPVNVPAESKASSIRSRIDALEYSLLRLDESLLLFEG